MVCELGILMMLVAVSLASPCTGTVCSYTFEITSNSSHLWGNHKVGMINSTLVTVPNQFRPFQPATPVSPEDVGNVVTLDGHQRDVIHINGQFPGPTIDVMKGVQVGLSDYFWHLYFCKRTPRIGYLQQTGSLL